MGKHVQPDSDQDKGNDEPSVTFDLLSKSPMAGEIVAKHTPKGSHQSEDQRIERDEAR